MASLHAWLSALRPRTLFLANATALSGSGMAYGTGRFSVWVFVLTLATANILQIISNLANDLGDYQHGADTTGTRIGPERAVQSGAITPRHMHRAIYGAVALAVVVGSVLVWQALYSLALPQQLLFLALGLASITAAICYTAGPRPYGYRGWGDAYAFAFFGPVCVVGTYFLHTHSWNFQPWLPGIGLGLLTACVLNLNNMRDIDSDRQAGKYTIPVRIGLHHAKCYHTVLTLGALACFGAYAVLYVRHGWQAMNLLAFAYFFLLLRRIWHITDHRLFDPCLKFTAIGIFVLSVSFCLCINS